MKNVVIVDGLRTPFGRLGGGLRQFHNVEMGGMVIKGLLEKTQLDPKEVDAVYYGTANGVVYIADDDSLYATKGAKKPTKVFSND